MSTEAHLARICVLVHQGCRPDGDPLWVCDEIYREIAAMHEECRAERRRGQECGVCERCGHRSRCRENGVI